MRFLFPKTISLTLRVISGDEQEQELSEIELRRLLLHRLKVLEAALQRVAELQRIAADAPIYKHL